MNILFTGANGFLGRNIINNLENISDIIRLGRSDNNDIICDLSSHKPIFKQLSFDIVIHASGLAHEVNFKNDFNKYSLVNITGTKNLIEGLSKITVKKFVFISSVSVYGLIEGLNINESSPLLANDSYGISKIKAEEIIIKWCTENNVTCTILRLPLVIGVDPPGNLGKMIHAIKIGYYFNVAGGKAKKSMVLASDISKFIFLSAEVGGIYNLTDGIHPTFNELSKCISHKFKRTYVPNMPFFIATVLAQIGNKLGNVFPINSIKLSKILSTLTFDDSKARIAFGWKPTPIVEGFKLDEDAK